MSENSRYASPLSADYTPGDDDDLPGYDQPLTADDVDAVLQSPEPAETRREVLMQMRNDLEARMSMDQGTELAPLLENIDNAIASLEAVPDEIGTEEGYGMDAGDRTDNPDDLLERAEDEAEEDQD